MRSENRGGMEGPHTRFDSLPHVVTMAEYKPVRSVMPRLSTARIARRFAPRSKLGEGLRQRRGAKLVPASGASPGASYAAWLRLSLVFQCFPGVADLAVDPVAGSSPFVFGGFLCLGGIGGFGQGDWNRLFWTSLH